MNYTVVAGDTLSDIADNFGVSVSDIVNANASITDPNLIRVGQVINIPLAGDSSSSAPATISTTPSGAISEITVTAQKIPVTPAPSAPFTFASLFKPPRLYYTLAIGAGIAWLLTQDD